MFRLPLALAALVALSGCADYVNGPWNGSNPLPRRAPTYDDRYDDYRRSSEYRRVSSDAAEYARYVERNLRSGHESAIRQIVARRAEDLLQRTRTRDHNRVYPFPRRNGQHNGFWNAVDRDIQNRIGSRYADEYRYLVRNGEARYRDRYQNRSDRGRYGRDDGQRGRSDDRRRDRGDDDDRRRGRDDDRRDRDNDDDDRADRRRQGESLQDWYRRQRNR